MNIFCDFSHSGLARSIFYVFADRLGHNVKFADLETSIELDKLSDYPYMVWNIMIVEWVDFIGGIDREVWNERSGNINLEEFYDTDWDAVIISRTETESVYNKLLKKHRNKKKIKKIAISGNEHTSFNWRKVKNLIATDEQTYNLSPKDIHKIWSVQEIGRQYGKEFVPITEQNLKRVNAFINNLGALQESFVWNFDMFNGKCPHCKGLKPGSFRPVNVPRLWRDSQRCLPDYTFTPYGLENQEFGGDFVHEINLADAYTNGALTWHFKTFEGWGHSLLQSIVCGRPVIIPRNFYRHRTAGKYLIPEVNCFECDWDARSIKDVVKRVTQDVDTANHYAEATFNLSKSLFNWEHEAWRLSRWLEELR